MEETILVLAGSGKKYKNCCLNKVIQVDFSSKEYKDCVKEENSMMFFALRNLLLDYTNQKYNINKKLRNFDDICDAESEELIDIRDKLLRYILPDVIEDEIIDIKDKLWEN